ncbi:MAG: hypothetical protein LBT53_05710 [Puniceicoccales bacterium]|jgi:hypothetical protein|nr:hypothetical protein [Puniceicoccales bacterium]
MSTVSTSAASAAASSAAASDTSAAAASGTTAKSTPLLGPLDWVLVTAHRLRYFQANFADDPRESREAFLEEELRRLLEPVPPSKRQEYLDLLAEKFPTWESLATTVAPAAAPLGTDAAGAAAAPQTPEDVLALFLRTLPRFDNTLRQLIKKRLADEGFVSASGDALSPETFADLTEKLKFAPADNIAPSRLGKLFASLAEFALATDQLVWSVWKSLAPKSTLRRDSSAGDLRTALRRSLTGDAEVSALQVGQQLEKLRQLTAALIAALGPAAKIFATDHATRYSPEAVRDAVKLEGVSVSVFGNADARLWKKYTELAGEINEDSIRTTLIDAIAKYAEDLAGGGR